MFIYLLRIMRDAGERRLRHYADVIMLLLPIIFAADFSFLMLFSLPALCCFTFR